MIPSIVNKTATMKMSEDLQVPLDGCVTHFESPSQPLKLS